MTQRTCNIIMCCKGNCKLLGPDCNREEAIKAYMGKECDFPPDKYTDAMFESIVKEALIDFASSCDNPGFLIRELLSNSVWMQYCNILQRMIITLLEYRLRMMHFNM